MASAKHPGRWAPAAVIAAAFLVRFVGIGYGLPDVYHQDEPMMVHHALAIGTGDWNTHYFVIPPFVSYFLFAIYGVFYLAGRVLGAFGSPEDFAIAFLADPTLFYVLGRLFVGVLFGTASVAALYFTGKRHFSRETGLAAAFLLALAPLHVQLSHYIYADVPVTFFIILFMDRLFRIVERPVWKNYLWAGLFLGWGTAVKYTAAYFVPVIVIAHALGNVRLASGEDGSVLPLRGRRRNRATGRDGLVKLAAAGALSVGVFAVLAPYTFLDWGNFIATMKRQAAGESPIGWTHHLLYSLGNGAGPLFLAAAVSGLVRIWREARPKAAVLLAAIVLFYGIHVYFSQHYARYILPLVPLLCLAAGAAVGRRFLPLALVALTLAVPSLYLDLLFLKTDTRTQSAVWFERNAASGSVVVTDSRFFGPHLAQSPEALAGAGEGLGAAGLDQSRRLRLELLRRAPRPAKTYDVRVLAPEGVPQDPEFTLSGPFVEATPQALAEARADYLVFNFTEADPRSHALRKSAGNRYERAAVFTPYRSPSKAGSLDPHATTAGPHTLAELFSRNRLGPYLEIWKAKDAA